MNTQFDDPCPVEERLTQLAQVLGESRLADSVLEELRSEQGGLVPKDETSRPVRRETGGFGSRQMARVSWMGATALVVFCGAAVLLIGPSGTTLAQVAESVCRVSSYSVEITVRERKDGDAGAGQDRVIANGKLYWRRPNDFRHEMKSRSRSGDLDSREDSVWITFSDRSGISWDNSAKTFRPEAARRGYLSPLMILQDLGSFANDASRLSGSKEIGTMSCDGFEIPMRTIDSNVGDGKVTLWIDRKSHLPAQVTVHAENPAIDMLFENFSWDVQLDETLFAIAPPAGFELDRHYVDRLVSEQERAEKIVAALRTYSELSGGDYPQVAVIYGDVTRDSMFEFAGYNRGDLSDYFLEETYAGIMEAGKGFAIMNEVMRDNADASYHGRTVSPRDSDKVLFRWKLADGRYQVILGDLSVDTVAD